ncbi:hypothetical protein SUGI_0714630 [Cryptomeria japonica]|nr:hypothetical protein SUGI_0714630 [Cryptomeria japonica]
MGAPLHYDGIDRDEVKAFPYKNKRKQYNPVRSSPGNLFPDQDEEKECPSKSKRKQYKPVRSSLGNLFFAAPGIEEELSCISTYDRRNKKGICSPISTLEESSSQIRKWRKSHCGDGVDNFEISTEKDVSEINFDSLAKSEMGMEESDAATALYPKNLTCVKCGRDFSTGKALGPHVRCGNGIQKNKCKASTLKKESPVKKDGIQGDKNWSCSLCGTVCPSIQSLGGHTKACRKNHF